MQAVELPLFEFNNSFKSEKSTLKQAQIPAESDANLATAMGQVLEQVSQELTPKPQIILENSSTLKQSLNELFPEQQYDEKDLQKAKEILGSLTTELSPQQLKDTIVEFEFLAENWLDDFERQIFSGQTLAEMLHEKGGL